MCALWWNKRRSFIATAFVDWYCNELFNGECLHYAYTQVGQEKLLLTLMTDKGKLLATFDERCITFSLPDGDDRTLSLRICYDAEKTDCYRAAENRVLSLRHRGFSYEVSVDGTLFAKRGEITASARGALTLTVR